MSEHPTLTVAVLVERLSKPSQWEDWRFRIADVQPDAGTYGAVPRLLRDDGHTQLKLFPGLPVTLYTDESEGYYLNLTSGAPAWFVMWRVEEDDPSAAQPELVTLSYNEAGRLLEAEERVQTVALPPDVRGWLQAFTDAHYRPEPKRRVRPASFRRADQR